VIISVGSVRSPPVVARHKSRAPRSHGPLHSRVAQAGVDPNQASQRIGATLAHKTTRCRCRRPPSARHDRARAPTPTRPQQQIQADRIENQTHSGHTRPQHLTQPATNPTRQARPTSRTRDATASTQIQDRQGPPDASPASAPGRDQNSRAATPWDTARALLSFQLSSGRFLAPDGCQEGRA
jgi:hypothetical protein